MGSVTFSLTLTIGCELLVLCQSLQLTMSKKKVQLLSLWKDIYSPPWRWKDCQADNEHLWWKANWLRCCGSAFCGKIPKNASCWSCLWQSTKLKIDKINAIYFYHSYANLHHCYAALSYIFTLKKKVLKHADFASERQKLCFREVDVSKFFGGGFPRTPPTSWAPFIEPFMLKTWICPGNTQIFPVKVLELEPCVYEPLWYRLANPQKAKNVRFWTWRNLELGKVVRNG